jgi:hypothetical protein
VFLTQVDPDEMAASLDSDAGSFLSNTAFVRRFLSGAGWELPPLSARDLPALMELGEVTNPSLGDLVLYYDDQTPYHVGVLEADEVVLSATLNGGVRRAPLGAFAGKVRYRRPLASARVLTPTPVKAPQAKAKNKATVTQRRKR